MIFICILVFFVGVGLGILYGGMASKGSYSDQIQDAYNQGYERGLKDKTEER